MFAYCGNNPVMGRDPTGRFVDWDLYPNATSGRKFTEWYLDTDVNEIGSDGTYTLDAKIKKTVNSVIYNLEFSFGVGVGAGQKLNVTELGGGLLCHYDFFSVQYCDGVWEMGDRIEMVASVTFTQAYEYGAGLDAFRPYGEPVAVNPNKWFPYNDKKESWTIFSFANYSLFLGGNVTLGYDLNTLLSDLSQIWGWK